MSNDLSTQTPTVDPPVGLDLSIVVEENSSPSIVVEKKKRIPRSERVTKNGTPYKPHVYTEKRRQQFIEKCQAARMRSLKPVAAE